MTGVGCREWGIGCRVSGVGCRVWGVVCRVKGVGYGSVRARAARVAPLAEPQKALSGGIPGSFLEPLGRSWSHFVGIYRQKLTRSLDN